MGEIEDVGYRDLIPAGIVLTGGTSLLKGLPEFVSERYDIAVRRGRPPHGIHGLRDIVESPIYSTVIGLVKYAVESKEYRYREASRRYWSTARARRSGVSGLFGRLLRWLNRFFRG
jgi:cell division protein FtsA